MSVDLPLQELVSEEVDGEQRRRGRVAALVQAALLVLRASHTALPAARWFSQRVRSAIHAMAKLNKVSQICQDQHFCSS